MITDWNKDMITNGDKARRRHRGKDTTGTRRLAGTRGRQLLAAVLSLVAVLACATAGRSQTGLPPGTPGVVISGVWGSNAPNSPMIPIHALAGSTIAINLIAGQTNATDTCPDGSEVQIVGDGWNWQLLSVAYSPTPSGPYSPIGLPPYSFGYPTDPTYTQTTDPTLLVITLPGAGYYKVTVQCDSIYQVICSSGTTQGDTPGTATFGIYADAPDFGFGGGPSGSAGGAAVSPNPLTVVRGASAAATVTVAPIYGLNRTLSDAVHLTVWGTPLGLGASFNPTTVTPATGPAASTLTVAAGPYITPGDYTLTLTGASAYVAHSVPLLVHVVDFSLAAGPSSLRVGVGASAITTVTTTALNNFGALVGPVALSVSGLPAHVTAAFSPASVGPTGASALTLTASSSAAAGTSTVTVTGAAGGVTRTATLSLTVTSSADFNLAASPAALGDDSQTGGHQAAQVTLTAVKGFSSAVALSVSGLPSGVTAAFGATTVTPTASGASTSLTLTCASGVAAGVYPLTVTATGGGKTHTAAVTLTVGNTGDFTVPTGTSVTVTRGTSGTASLPLVPVNGFTGPVVLTASGLPAGMTVWFSPSGNGTETMYVCPGANTPTGTYTITVTATSGGLTHTFTVTIVVQ